MPGLFEHIHARADALGPSAPTEAVQLFGEPLKASVSANTTSRKSITRDSREFATEPAKRVLGPARNRGITERMNDEASHPGL